MKRADSAIYGRISLSRQRRGNIENKAQSVIHLRRTGSSSAKRLAGRRGSRIDFSCTVIKTSASNANNCYIPYYGKRD
jgi:hypothetical protein